jgi:predicted ArsR family transcriptional regulator
MRSHLSAVADPTRLRITRHLAEEGEATLSELAEAAGVHANTARAHLAELERSGLVVRHAPAGGGRGRPRLRYRLAEGWSVSTGELRGLAELLAAALQRVAPDREALRAIGADWGRYLAGRPGQRDAADSVPSALERLGFHATMTNGELRLSGCPCPIVAPQRPELVCQLADAVVEGVLAASGDDLRLAAAHHDTGRRRCRATIERRNPANRPAQTKG